MGYNYNVGYGLCVAIGDDLPTAISGAKEFAKYLYSKKTGRWGIDSDYVEVTNLFNSDATLCNVLNAFFDLIQKSVAGDVVTIYFGLHGTGYMTSRTDPTRTFMNELALKGSILNEDEIYLLLTLFKPGVRVILVFDICRSGSWLDKISLAECMIYETHSALMRKLKRTKNEKMIEIMTNLYPIFLKSKINATVTAIGCVSDIIDVIDDLSFMSYLNLLHEEKSTKYLNMDAFMRELRNKVYKLIPNIDPLMVYDGGGSRGVHENLWSIYYQTYYAYKNQPCWLREEDIPKFDPYNQEHHEALLSFLPHYKYIGPGHHFHLHKVAFGVN